MHYNYRVKLSERYPPLVKLKNDLPVYRTSRQNTKCLKQIYRSAKKMNSLIPYKRISFKNVEQIKWSQIINTGIMGTFNF